MGRIKSSVPASSWESKKIVQLKKRNKETIASFSAGSTKEPISKLKRMKMNEIKKRRRNMASFPSTSSSIATETRDSTTSSKQPRGKKESPKKRKVEETTEKTDKQKKGKEETTKQTEKTDKQKKRKEEELAKKTESSIPIKECHESKSTTTRPPTHHGNKVLKRKILRRIKKSQNTYTSCMKRTAFRRFVKGIMKDIMIDRPDCGFVDQDGKPVKFQLASGFVEMLHEVSQKRLLEILGKSATLMKRNKKSRLTMNHITSVLDIMDISYLLLR